MRDPNKLLLGILLLLSIAVTHSIKAEQITHAYDNQNRLIRTEYEDGAGIEYTYDAAGNRIGQKPIPANPTLAVERKGEGNGIVKGNGIDCGSDCVESYPKGSGVSLTATAAAGSVFGGWNEACSGTGTCTLTMDASKKVVATFHSAPANPTLTVEKQGPGSGTVKGNGIDCGSDCVESYPKDTGVSLTATATAGSVFGGWSEACSGTGACSLTVDVSKKVVATFNTTPANPYPLTVTRSPYGVVSSSPDGILCGGTKNLCKGSFSLVSLTATPKPGYYLKKWIGCPAPGNNTCILTVTRNTTIKPFFAKLPLYTLKINKPKGSGGIHVEPGGKKCKNTQSACSFKFPKGTGLTLTAHPASGRSLLYWGGACSGNQDCTITMDGTKKVTANFQ